jgi:hypothetical protein
MILSRALHAFGFFLACGLLCIFTTACFTTSPSSVADSPPAPIQARTELPTSWSGQKFEGLPNSVAIAPGLVKTAWVVRPRAEVREGPGVDFSLLSQVLVRGEQVMIFNRVGVWQLVIAPSSGVRGWIHHQAIGRTEENTGQVVVRASLLPRLFAVRPVKTAWEHPSMTPRSVDVPQGTAFVLLRETAGRKLVWIQEKNSVIWFDRASVE